MKTLFIGHNFIDLAEAGSTNDFALELLKERAPEGTVVRAAHQLKGRGQKGNQWHSEPGTNLLLSVILYPHFLSAQRAWDLSRITCLALCQTLRNVLPGADIFVKWPNDLLANGRKAAGILIENVIEGEKLKASVIGIGLNVNQTEFPEEKYKKAGSLKSLSGMDYSLDEIMEMALSHLEALYLALRSGKTDVIERAYLSSLMGYQEMVNVKLGRKKGRYLFVGVNPQGRMALQIGSKLKFFDVKEAEIIY